MLSSLTVSGLPGPGPWCWPVVVHGPLFHDILAFGLLRDKQNWHLEGKHSARRRRARELAAPLSCGVPQPLQLGLAVGGLSLIYLDRKRQYSNR